MVSNSPIGEREGEYVRHISRYMNMTKIKPLLPSLREKKRYIAYEIISKEKLNLFTDINEIEETIMESSLEYMGILGMAQANIMVLKDKFESGSQKGLIRVANKSVDNMKASLALIAQIGKNDVIIRSVGVSGIMKKAYDNYISG